MPTHRAKRRPLVVANARHSPSDGCALRPDRTPFFVLLGHAQKLSAFEPRVIGFLASREGEGTSTLARNDARANAGELGRNGLLLSTLPPGDGSIALCDTLRSGQPIESALANRQRGTTEASLGLGTNHENQPDDAWDLVTRRELWDFLRRRFDLIVLVQCLMLCGTQENRWLGLSG